MKLLENPNLSYVATLITLPLPVFYAKKLCSCKAALIKVMNVYDIIMTRRIEWRSLI
jgi:hypothetical protein